MSVKDFSGTTSARILKLGTHSESELYHIRDKRESASHCTPFPLSIFLSFSQINSYQILKFGTSIE